MRVLVTGASGFIGSSVVQLLARAGHTARCLLRTSSNTDRIAGVEFESFIGDLLLPESLRTAAEGCEAVIHLASVSNWDDIHSSKVTAIGLEGTEALLEAALAAGCRRFVYVSSAAALGGEQTPIVRDESASPSRGIEKLVYADMKRRAERTCFDAMARGLEVVVVNPSEVYGAEDRDLITASNLIDFAEGPVTLVCAGGTGVVHLDDVGAGIVAALQKGRSGERYLLSSENLSNRQIAATVLEFLGRKQPILPFPRPIVRGLGWLGVNWGVPMPFNPAIAPYATLYWYVDNRKAQEELGVRFRPAREAIRDAVEWLRRTDRL